MIRTTSRIITGRYAIVLAWMLLLLGLPEYRQWVPGSNWLVVNSIRVNSTFVGNDPTIFVDRELTMGEPTIGGYAVTLSRDGVGYCSTSAKINYRPRGKLPATESRKLFGYWFGLKPGETPAKFCRVWPLPAGEYCLETQWNFEPENYPVKTVEYGSREDQQVCFFFVNRSLQ